MSSMLREPEHGCLIIGDISGYTGLLVDSELDHAQDAMRDLIRTVVESLRGQFRLAKLEGDAVFAYAVTDRLDGSVLLDTIEHAYFAFRRRLEAIGRATTCNCNACIRIPSLNLKFVVHHGRFVRDRLYGTEELTGADVIVVHRLLKNSVVRSTGTEAYALLTDACVAAAGLDPAPMGMVEHHEQYEELGEITAWVHDLEARWQLDREQRRVRVTDRSTVERIEADLAASSDVVWRYLTDPAERARLIPGVQRIDEVAADGRRGIGTRNHCVHGAGATLEEILDWRPFEYFTLESNVPGLVRYVSMTELEATAAGTHVVIRFQRPRTARDRVALEALVPQLIPIYQATIAALQAATADTAS